MELSTEHPIKKSKCGRSRGDRNGEETAVNLVFTTQPLCSVPLICCRVHLSLFYTHKMLNLREDLALLIVSLQGFNNLKIKVFVNSVILYGTFFFLHNPAFRDVSVFLWFICCMP